MSNAINNISKLLEFAKLSFESANYQETVNCCNIILVEEPLQYKASLLKGKAIARQSYCGNNRLLEAAKFFKEARNNAPDEEKEKIIKDAIKVIKDNGLRIVQERANWCSISYYIIDYSKDFYSDKRAIMSAIALVLTKENGLEPSNFFQDFTREEISLCRGIGSREKIKEVIYPKHVPKDWIELYNEISHEMGRIMVECADRAWKNTNQDNELISKLFLECTHVIRMAIAGYRNNTKYTFDICYAYRRLIDMHKEEDERNSNSGFWLPYAVERPVVPRDTVIEITSHTKRNGGKRRIVVPWSYSSTINYNKNIFVCTKLPKVYNHIIKCYEEKIKEIEEKEKKEKIEKYWEKHGKERQKLKKERNDLANQITLLINSQNDEIDNYMEKIKSIPGNDKEIRKIKHEIIKLKKQKSNLGLLHIKEKIDLKTKIELNQKKLYEANQRKCKRMEIQKKINDIIAKIQIEIKPLEEKMNLINAELTKDR